MRLALDISLAGLALGIERVEFEIEIVLGRFARVDRAALRFWKDWLHDRPVKRRGEHGVPDGASPIRRRPKKRGPFQFVPVIFWATVDRLE